MMCQKHDIRVPLVIRRNGISFGKRLSGALKEMSLWFTHEFHWNALVD